MKIFVLLCFALVCCQKPGTLGSFNFSNNFAENAKIVRLSCYQTKSRFFYSENYLRELDQSSTSTSGDHADSLWRKLKIEATVPHRLTSFKNFTSKDYQIIAENDKGELSSIIITKTYLKEDGRYLACIQLDQDYFCELSESEVALLGVK